MKGCHTPAVAVVFILTGLSGCTDRDQTYRPSLLFTIGSINPSCVLGCRSTVRTSATPIAMPLVAVDKTPAGGAAP